MFEKEEIGRDAYNFLNSERGHYILAQALTLGIEKLEEVDGVYREESNILDMKYLLESLFREYAMILQVQKGLTSNDK